MNLKITPSDQTSADFEAGLNLESSTSNLEPSTANLQPSTANDIAVSVRNVSKMYPLYAQPSDRLKQSLWYALPGFCIVVPPVRGFRALRDILLELKLEV